MNIVERLLSSHGVRLVSGHALQGEAISSAIMRRIEEADGLIALLTRRDKLADGGWSTHMWVRDELEYAYRLGKPTVCFVESGVNPGLGLIEREQIRFDREDVLLSLLKLSDIIGKWKEVFVEQAERFPAAASDPYLSDSAGSQRETALENSRRTNFKDATRGRVFISYRRQDARGRAGRLADNLRIYLGHEYIFLDTDDILPGTDYLTGSLNAVAQSQIVLAIIGTEWLTVRNQAGQIRLMDPADLLRRELKIALERNLTVIPILIDDAKMPRQSDIPSDIRAFTRKNAIEIRDTRWTYDVRFLADLLAKQLGVETPGFESR